MYRVYMDGSLCFQGSNKDDAYGYYSYAHKRLSGTFLSMTGPGKDGENTVLHEANLSKKHHKSA